MKLITLFIFSGLILRPFRLPLFESIITLLLLLPLGFYVLGPYFSEPALAYYTIFGLLILLTYIFVPKKAESQSPPNENIAATVLFCSVYYLSYQLCLLWPDFFSLGERMRDYAVLSSVLRSPIDLQEPWLAGVQLSYYAYWYRFAHMLATVLSLEPWQAYHGIVAFVPAFFVASVFRLLGILTSICASSRLLCSLAVTFGSNLAGIFYLFDKQGGWWSPSRVVLGGITEFPAWSFLLGDAHPHYLNLATVIFFITVFCQLSGSVSTVGSRVLLVLAGIIVPTLFLVGANVWDVPIWISVVLAISGMSILARYFQQERINFPGDCTFTAKEFAALGGILILSVLLFVSSRNFQAVEAPVRFVSDPIARTTMLEFLMHWGLPISAIALVLIFSLKSWFRLVATGLLVATLFLHEAIWFLLVLLLLNSYRVWLRLSDKEENSSFSSKDLVIEAIGFCALGFLLVPEIVFLDDPYGGESERMNTIFKLYSAAWVFVHCFAIMLFAQTFRTLRWPFWIRTLVLCLILGVMSSFFVTTLSEREIKLDRFKPTERGLNTIDQRYHGAGMAAVLLHNEVPGVVLEAQGPAYSETTLIATLANKQAYLGWVNHMDLLYPEQRAEIARRKAVTTQVYEELDCSKRKEILLKEGIRYFVVGSLEKKFHPMVKESDFGCLDRMFEQIDYAVYRIF